VRAEAHRPGVGERDQRDGAGHHAPGQDGSD